jgi:hypothetical protein
VKHDLRVLSDPGPHSIPADCLDFLRALDGSALIHVTGTDSRRTRAIATLLHGDEPSGFRALHRWLRQGERPRTSLLCLVGAVEAALHEAPFTHRHLPGVRDLNRCFREPFADAPGLIARQFLEALRRHEPECLVDIHNTSGRSPAFAVAPREDRAHEALAAVFCRHLVITDLSIGALMETSGDPCPAITFESGGARDARSDEAAWAGLSRFIVEAEVLKRAPELPAVELYHHPVRLEFEPGTRLAWHESPQPDADLTLRPDLERFNFEAADPNAPLGWLGPRGLAPLRVRSGSGRDVLGDYFCARDGRLHPVQPLRFFMVTSSARMALADCLLYAAAERDHTRLLRGRNR